MRVSSCNRNIETDVTIVENSCILDEVMIDGDFERDGAVRVRGLVDPELLSLAESAIDAVLRDPSPLAIRASVDDDGVFIEDFCNWARVPALEAFIRRCSGSTVAADLLGSDTVRLYHDHILVKEAGTVQRTPWHQDQPYYNVDGRQGVSMWLPVDPVPRVSSLEVVAGSHLGPWFVPRTFLGDEARWFPEGTLAELPDYETDPPKIVSWDLEPGDAVFFHFATVHGSGGTDARRRVLSVRYIGDDIRFAPRPWRTSPPFDGLDEGLAAGGPLDHPAFPRL
jgi:ectoine hydroxylase-related dioxygenase (phytanoyl-CoA dioxygenase family)